VKRRGPMGTLNLGIVGACGRGASFKAACDAMPDVAIHAICDIAADGLAAAAERLGARETYDDYETMLDRSDLDAVIVGTPMHHHAAQAIAALERNVSVLSEVTAGVTIDECRKLVEACRASRATYMMAENYTYTRPNTIVREMVRRGVFGTTYYAEGEYLHELKHMNEYETPWRRRWQTGIDGVTYGTHSLGPILQWMPGDRVARVCCEAAGVRQTDHTGRPYCQACSTMLCKMASGGLVKIRVDMVSDRPHSMTNYQLQGTDGCYESARASGERHRVWLRDRCPDPHTWMTLDDFSEEFLPEFWKAGAERARAAGHGGGDYFEILDFVDAVRGGRRCPIGIDEAMDMTLPGLVSQQSILEDGRWLDVPDSRDWSTEIPSTEIPSTETPSACGHRLLP
jgi:predicted dehydrogenase